MAEDPEKVRAQRKRYYEKHKKKLLIKMKAYRLVNIEEKRAYGRKWIRDKWRNDPEYRRKHAEVTKKYREKNRVKTLFWNNTAKRKFKRAANAQVLQAVKMNRIIRPDKCQHCHKKCKPEGHHHRGYVRALDVVWLCTSCHGEIHRK